MNPIEVVCTHVTIGAVGEPGQRTFYLQGGDGRRLFTLKIEKGQAAALTERLIAIVDDIAASAGPDPVEAAPDLSLQAPIEQDFVVGVMSLGYEPDRDMVVIACEEYEPDQGEPDQGEPGDRATTPAVLFLITRTRARTLARHAEAIVTAGRPSCELCGFPKGPEHVCPRSNGRHERAVRSCRTTVPRFPGCRPVAAGRMVR